jgi:hypothetical protein
LPATDMTSLFDIPVHFPAIGQKATEA